MSYELCPEHRKHQIPSFSQISGAAFISTIDGSTHVGDQTDFSRHTTGSVLYRQGDPATGIFLVLRGRVKTWAITLNERTALRKIAGPGEVLGLAAMVSANFHATTAQSTELSLVAFLRKNDLTNTMQECPQLSRAVAQYLARYEEVLRAAQKILAIYNRNVFPQMNITWGSYPNNIGHTEFTGCFRCHDEQHARADGKTITQDCTACHSMVAVDEKQPKILMDLGIEEPKQP